MACITPIVFFIYRRPDLTSRVFEAIREAKPFKFFIVADGPRNTEEELLCYKTRKIIDKVDWDCEIIKNYSDINFGCRHRISSGLNWVFEQVEEAIILEDDCLPSQSFFAFCHTLLDYYRNDTRIWMISGNNFQDGKVRGDGSYYFSRYPHCWGWATWKRAWMNYQDDLTLWPKFRDSGLMSTVFEDPKEVQYWANILNDLLLKEKPDSWAYRWAYSCWSNSALTALPNINLVSNIGFGNTASNTIDFEKRKAHLPAGDISSLKHPSFLLRDAEADSYTAKKLFSNPFGNHFFNKAQGRIKSEVKKALSFIKK